MVRMTKEKQADIKMTKTHQVVDTSRRLSEMLQRKEQQCLSAHENSDLNRYLRLEHLLSLAQTRSRKTSIKLSANPV